MTNQNPITPPPELVAKWASSMCGYYEAARWGADQELEACCEWLEKDLDAYELVGLRAVYLDHNLHAARRPKPPSLKEQALAVLDDCSDRLDSAHENIIRRALEALDD